MVANLTNMIAILPVATMAVYLGNVVQGATMPVNLTNVVTPPPPLQKATLHAAPSCSVGSVSGPALVSALKFFAAAQCLLQEPWPESATVSNGSRFDFIVVGGGTAGSTLAARLADKCVTVLLIEAGQDPPQDSIIPGYHSTMMGGPYDWKLRSANDSVTSQAFNDGSQPLPRGKVLGGTGTINDMVYARGFPVDYDEWAQTIGTDWDWEHVLPFFKKTEHLTDERIINDPDLMRYHARGGEIEVSGLNASTFDTDMFLNTFNESGFRIVKDMTNPHEIGVGRISHTIRDGRRDSSLTALLNKASKQNKDNLFVLKNALVTKVLFENKTAEGVKVRLGGEEVIFYASNEVILSAGAYNTPKLLMLSGVGPEDHLKEMGIDVVADSPVGENLQDHFMVLYYMAADNGTCYTDEATNHMNTIRYFYDRSGPLSYVNTMTAYMALDKSQPNVPGMGFYPSCTPMGTRFYESCVEYLGFNSDICTKLNNVLKENELITIAAVLLKPKSRGRVRLNSADALEAPLIYLNALADDEDLHAFDEAVKVVDSIKNSKHFRQKNARIVVFGSEASEGVEDKNIYLDARARAMSAWHPVGTAAMGSVLDSRMRVRGVSRLRVVDASAMPSVVRGNTNAPVIMVAEKAAEFIAADLSHTDCRSIDGAPHIVPDQSNDKAVKIRSVRLRRRL